MLTGARRRGAGAGSNCPAERNPLVLVRRALVAAQVTFLLMLALPFMNDFLLASPWETGTYVVTLLSAALAVVAFISLVVDPRGLFRTPVTAYSLPVLRRLAVAGTALLAVAVCSGAVLIGTIAL